MATIEELLEELRRNPRHVRFRDADRVRGAYCGEPRTHGSHHVFKTPWQGNPRINIQNRKGSSRHIRFRNCFEQSTLWRC